MRTKTTTHRCTQTMLTRESYTKRLFWIRFFGSQSHNLKSKACPRSRSGIKNRKWVGMVAIVCVIALVGLRAEAQQAGKIFRIGYLDRTNASGSQVLVEAFRQELSKLGWIEGRNITIERRFADQKLDRLPALAAELAHLKVDLIVTGGFGPTRAAKDTTVAIPIVMAQDPDPVGNGLVVSLARPGGNVTGLSALANELGTKRLEILKDTMPKLNRVAYLTTTDDNEQMRLARKEIRAAARALTLNLEEIETQLDAKGLDSAFQAAKQKQV